MTTFNWLKMASEEIKNQANGISDFEGHQWRDIGADELQNLKHKFDWMNEYYSDEEEIPHDTPYHQESLIEHIRQVSQQIKNFRAYPNNPLLADLLAIAGIFHDHWKIRTRAPKTRFICPDCNYPNTKSEEPCKNCGSESSKQEKEVMGYHGHEELGSRSENLFPRLESIGVPRQYWEIVQFLVRNHLAIHDLIETLAHNDQLSEKQISRWSKMFSNKVGIPLEDMIRMSIILSMADNLGRITQLPSKYTMKDLSRGKVQETQLLAIADLMTAVVVKAIQGNNVSKKSKPDISKTFTPEQIQRIDRILDQVGISLFDTEATDRNKLFNLLSRLGMKRLIQEILKVL